MYNMARLSRKSRRNQRQNKSQRRNQQNRRSRRNQRQNKRQNRRSRRNQNRRNRRSRRNIRGGAASQNRTGTATATGEIITPQPGANEALASNGELSFKPITGEPSSEHEKQGIPLNIYYTKAGKEICISDKPDMNVKKCYTKN